MDRDSAVRLFESLASGVRLDMYRLLVRRGPEGATAGEIARAFGLAANNASFHLKAMTHAELVSVTAEGRFQRYRARFEVMNALIAYLTAECCDHQPERCVPHYPSTPCSFPLTHPVDPEP